MRFGAASLAYPAMALILSLVLGACSRTVLTGSKSVSQSGLRIWFVKPKGEDLALVSVVRPLRRGDKLEQAITELLQGPEPAEATAGLASEIPRGTILLGIRNQGNDIELNLSRRFASGGGSSSLEMRLEQLTRTIAAAEKRKVYLSVEGERLSTASGEGLEIHQPLN